jgi:hypothetical protein
MTFTNSSANPMPERIVLDIDAHEAMMTWLCDEHVEDESILYPVLLECMKFEKDSEYELAFFLSEWQEYFPEAARMIPVMSQLASTILEQIKQLKLYEHWYLNYRFEQFLPGGLVLVRLPEYRVTE